jgi:hypothetical protein
LKSTRRNAAHNIASVKPFKEATKLKVARVCFTVAIVLFISGAFIMCDCPGEYVLAAIFSGIALWLGTWRIRTWSALMLVASVAIAVLETGDSARQKARLVKRLQHIRESQAGTNQLDHGTNYPQAK